MNDEFPPLRIPRPQVADRRKSRPRPIPIPAEVLQRRREIARRLVAQIDPLSHSLSQLSPEQRQAVFYKLKHELPVDLVGTDLKPLAEHSDNFTLAVPRSDTLDKLAGKIDAFGTAELKKGHAPSEQLAARLISIVRGDPKDRLSQPLFDEYHHLVTREWVICEIEMVSLAQGRKKKRKELQRTRHYLAQAFASGTRGNFFEHEEAAGTCRAVIRCSGPLLKRLVEEPMWQTRISWFDARPRFETFHTVLRNFSVDRLGEIEPPSVMAPVVCVVDSGVTRGNPFLTPVSRPELAKSFLGSARAQPSDQVGHGSGVASLVAYYALNLEQGARNTGRLWVASARVLDARNEVEEGRLFSKVLAEVVDTFGPLGVRIFNLSVNVANRKWNTEAKRTIRRTSWIARTIDRLSRERDIVFVVSTGNIFTYDVRSHLAAGKSYPAYFAEEESALLDPAQAALALTVGAVAPGTLVVGPGAGRAIAEANQPSPFTRRGPGIARELKPELIDYGGNYIHDPRGGQVRSNPGTDVMMASHQLTPAIAHDSGSSFAAPRVAHKLGSVLADLQALGIGHISAPLLKAFLVNSANCERLGAELEQFRRCLDRVEPNLWRQVVGYGLSDAAFATECDPFSAVLFYQGSLEADRVAYFDVPVPPGLADAEDGTKRLIVTLVHAPEVQRWGLERYLGTTMKWRMFRGDVPKDEIIASMSVEDGDAGEEPERPGELPGKLKVTLRSRGCVQHDIFEWSRHQRHYSADTYTLAVAAYHKWRRKVERIPFGLVIRIEDTTRSAKVYSEVQEILAEIEIQAQARI